MENQSTKSLDMEPKKELLEAFGEFVAVVEKLRSKEGCPWDRAQTHDSLRPAMIEEAYEAVDAMQEYEAARTYENLREELGDVLLQVVMHSVIGEEEGIFTLEDVIRHITAKMLHRHPHVFGGKEWNRTEHEITWEELKAEEKAAKKEGKHPLREIPAALPALLRASKVQKKSHRLYAEGEDALASAGRLGELATELAKLLEKEQTLTEEAGRKNSAENTADVLTGDSPGSSSQTMAEAEAKLLTEALLQITNIAWQRHINPEMVLMDGVEDMIRKRCAADQERRQQDRI